VGQLQSHRRLVLLRAGRFDSKRVVAATTVGDWRILMAVMLANAFGRFSPRTS
jgi:hypothetical protein